jgi:methyltransferase (TIGR00027 family)
MEKTIIDRVSDTALWIAAYRAQETKRKDAAFQDLLAEKLAGEKGFKILREMPHTESLAFAMVVRTAAIDHLVLSAIEKGVDIIINLGAGLDTRPYRLNIPQYLNWIEVDFPEIVEYKNKMLENEKPGCFLRRIEADLTNDTQRKKLFAELNGKNKNALIITEG